MFSGTVSMLDCFKQLLSN